MSSVLKSTARCNIPATHRPEHASAGGASVSTAPRPGNPGNEDIIMALKFIPHTPRVLLAAGLLLGVAAAHAASGFAVTKNQEALVKPGMSTAEVQSALGRPAQDI